MTLPLLILAVCALLAGICFGPTHLFEHHLQKTFGWELLGHGEHGSDLATALISTIGGLLGIGLAYRFYAAESPVPGRLATRFRPLYEASLNKFYVDEAYDWAVVKTTMALAIVCEFLDIYLVDQLVIGIAKLPRKLGKDLLAGYQNGLIQFYAAVSALGVAVLLFILLLF
jgi:NADH-quinone oxidoreductase subunit L